MSNGRSHASDLSAPVAGAPAEQRAGPAAAPESPRPAVQTLRRSRRLSLLILAGLVLAAAALRLYGLNWDQFQHTHPDERFIIWVASTIHWPSDLSTALSPTQSPLNPFRWPPAAGELVGQPRAYAYGHFPLYLLVLIAHAGQALAQALGRAGLAIPDAWQQLAAYDYLSLAGRLISALCDLGTLLLVYFLGTRLWGRATRDRALASASGRLAGLLAAAAYAFAVLPIQLSHFYAVDVVLTSVVVAAVAVAVVAAQTGASWTWPAAGALAGLAVGSKFSAVLLVVPLFAAALYNLPNDGRPEAAALVVARRAAVMVLAGLAAFALTNPFVLLDPAAFWSNLTAQNAMVTGRMDAPYTRQFIGTVPWWYYIQQISQWGLGWPLGIAAWGGFVWAILHSLRGRAAPAQMVVLAWALPYFAVTGVLYARFPRYMAPLVPFLLVFAAGAGLALFRRLQERSPRFWRVAWQAAVVLILLVTAGWALAFSGVYSQVHPWIQASNWIYRNVPEGSKIVGEQWDDALPLAMDEIPGRPPKRTYRQVQLPLYDPDTPAKLDALVAQLTDADYVILASNRLWRPIGRLPQRYPLSSQYYRLLFDGELGFTQVAEFTAYPRLLGVAIPDDNADESFTVYDHPHPRIFANTGRLSAERLRARLLRYLPVQFSSVAPASVASAGPGARVPPAQSAAAPGAGKAPGHARLTARGSDLQPVQGQPADLSLSAPLQPIEPVSGLSDFRWNRLASQSPPVAVLSWWFVVSLFGWLAWPLVFPLLGGLRDRGYGLARLAGWLLVGWVHWLGVSLGFWQNTLAAIGLVLLLLAAVAALAAARQRQALLAFWRRRRRLLLAEEAIFACAFLAFVGIRLLDPDLWQPWFGGEKFMEFGFLNAILRSPHFPPYDPYFAGGTIQYYYYGLYLVSLPIKLTGIFPEVAFNLAVPGLYALSALAAFSLGASLARRPRGAGATGALAVVLALVLANQTGFTQLTSRLAQLGGAQPDQAFAVIPMLRGLAALIAGTAQWPGYDYWSVSRVIPYTINEFPFWSFLFADLHPHLIAMPVGLAVAALALNWLFVAERHRAVPSVPANNAGDLAGAGAPGTGAPGSGGPAAEHDARSDAAGDPVAAATLRPEIHASAAPLMEWEPTLPGEAQTAPAMVTTSGQSASALQKPGSDPSKRDALGSRWRSPAAARETVWPSLGRAFLLVVMLGALGPTNTWDLPVYYLLVAGALLLAGWRTGRLLPVVRGAVLALVVGVGAALFYLPFYLNYQPAFGDKTGPLLTRYLGLTQNGSPLRPWLYIWLFFLFLAFSYVFFEFWRRGSLHRRGVILLLAAAGIALILFMAGRPAAALAAFPLSLASGLALRRTLATRDTFVMLLLVLGLGIVAGIELVYLRDFLEGGDWYRMNTVFKFGMAAWLILGMAGAVILLRVWGELGRRSPLFGGLWQAGAVILLAAGLAFLPFGTQARVDDRFPGPRPAIGTLDGTAFMTTGRYAWPDDQHTIQLVYDYEAIHWLLDHVTGAPVVAEAPAGTYMVDGSSVSYDYYRAGGLRVASLTGLPTFVGQHQYEQRDAIQVSQRTALGQEFFTTTDLERTRAIMRDLRIEYVYVGQLERFLFSPASLAKFNDMARAGELLVVYTNPQVTIYRSKAAA